MVEQDSSQIRRMRITCWITKATDTLRTYKTCCFSTATMVRKGVSMLRRSTLPVLFESPFISNFPTYTHKQIFRNNFTVTFPQTPRGTVFLDTLLDTQSVIVHQRVHNKHPVCTTLKKLYQTSNRTLWGWNVIFFIWRSSSYRMLNTSHLHHKTIQLMVYKTTKTFVLTYIQNICVNSVFWHNVGYVTLKSGVR